MMTVADLIKKLEKQDPKRVVVVARDSEGNGYSPLASVETGAYRDETTYSGTVGLERLTPGLRKMGFTEEDVFTDGVPAVVLGPSN
jgi:hypothetical protein